MGHRNRVVVTGMGVIAPNGIGLKEYWRTLAAGQSGVGPITLFDPTGFKSRIAGEVKGFDPLDHMPLQWKPKRMGRHTQFAYAATQMALRDANFDPRTDSLRSVLPVCIGVSSSAFDVIESGFKELQSRGAQGINSGMVRNCQPQAAALLIAQKLGVQTQASTISSACNSGIDAIASAATMISSSDVELAIAGGADAPVTPLAMASLASAGLSSFANGDPARASRPYDASSDSGVISEGAGVVILENLDHALARGAQMYLEITGYAAQMDREPNDPFDGLEATMRMAMANAGRDVRDIDYICSYGPGHPILDASEVRMIRRVFSHAAAHVPVSSIKGVTGNPLSAAGPMQLISCALAFRHGVIPPTANHDSPLPDCELDFVPRKARKALLNCVLINVRGLGGGNSSMVVERVQED
ncbi:MAG: beta-ketoacyl-[acyl-carrier-protein] synthase family protein [Chthoniobacterales bacterium]